MSPNTHCRLTILPRIFTRKLLIWDFCLAGSSFKKKKIFFFFKSLGVFRKLTWSTVTRKMASLPAEPPSHYLQNKATAQGQHRLPPHGGPLPRWTLTAALHAHLPLGGHPELSPCFPLLTLVFPQSNTLTWPFEVCVIWFCLAIAGYVLPPLSPLWCF